MEINALDEEEENKETLKNRIIGNGIMGIFSEVFEADYHKMQKLLGEIFAQDRNLKFVKRTKRASEVEEEEELHKQISLYHSKESMHSGINETYTSLKDEIYYPKFKEHIQWFMFICFEIEASSLL